MESPLVNKRVHIRPIKRKGAWQVQLTNNPSHDGAFMYSGSRVRVLGLPYDVNRRRRVEVLTPEEREFFESTDAGLGLKKGDLSIYKEPDNYWDSFEVIIEGAGKSLDLMDVMDYMRYKFLLAQSDKIAPSWEDRFKKGTYKYAIVDEEIEVKERVAKRNQVNEANRFFGKMEDSPEMMIDFLNMYHKGRKAVPNNAKRSFLVAEIDKILESDLQGFLKVIQDPKYDIKTFINRCMSRDLIVKESGGEYYIQGEEDRFTMTELIDFLSNKNNQTIYGKLKAKLD